MQRFWLFAGQDYYPSGGMHDLDSRHDTLAEAESRGDILTAEDSCVWWHVMDLTTGAIVAGTYHQAYGAPKLEIQQPGQGTF